MVEQKITAKTQNMTALTISKQEDLIVLLTFTNY
jgi:hypothetical protein